MWAPEGPAFAAGVGPARAEPPRIAPAFGNEARGTFGTLYNDVHHEVSDFIQNGSSDGAASGLSAQGWAHRAAVQTQALARDTDAPATADHTAFLTEIAPWAEEAGQRLGVAPHLVAAHAALESGWGQRPLRQADGRDAHNLFGIKAGGPWSGSVVNQRTTEYEQGQAVKQTAAFRSYPDYASAFQDYARLLQGNTRYREALNAGDNAQVFAQGLARGGYATDPAYADKLARVAASVKSAWPTQSRD